MKNTNKLRISALVLCFWAMGCATPYAVHMKEANGGVWVVEHQFFLVFFKNVTRYCHTRPGVSEGSQVPRCYEVNTVPADSPANLVSRENGAR